MNKTDFDKLMQTEAKLAAADGKNKLLLHCCCAPCASSCLERLKDYFEITVLFYNPNIERKEFTRREDELKRLITETGWAEFESCDNSHESWLEEVKGLENEREGGARCIKCFETRLAFTARAATEGGFDYFSTTLTLSPLKNAGTINRIGESLSTSAKWLHCDFKKRDGYLRSLQLSKQFGLYRQNYCGCEFSRRER